MTKRIDKSILVKPETINILDQIGDKERTDGRHATIKRLIAFYEEKNNTRFNGARRDFIYSLAFGDSSEDSPESEPQPFLTPPEPVRGEL